MSYLKKRTSPFDSPDYMIPDVGVKMKTAIHSAGRYLKVSSVSPH